MAQSAGLKVFVVEDETIVAMLLEQMLEELECEVAGVAGQLAQAMELARSIDAQVAILDLNLSGQRVDPRLVAGRDAERRRPLGSRSAIRMASRIEEKGVAATGSLTQRWAPSSSRCRYSLGEVALSPALETIAGTLLGVEVAD